ncbi:MAG: GNAT family N-acetyltransferase [Rhodothermales bacterium]|nr:GNAT family N-acetyltransferase [Rhodothermales bacterium]
MTPSFSLIEARTPEALRQAFALRHRVFVDEQGIPAALDADGRDDASRHVLIRDGAVPVATGRVTPGPDGAAVLARIAVAPAYRGQGLGRRVVEALETLAREDGARRAVLHAHAYLERFYAAMGYVTEPEETEAGGYRLVTMGKTLRAAGGAAPPEGG